MGNTRSQRATDQNLGDGFGTAPAGPTTSRPSQHETSVATDTAINLCACMQSTVLGRRPPVHQADSVRGGRRRLTFAKRAQAAFVTPRLIALDDR